MNQIAMSMITSVKNKKRSTTTIRHCSSFKKWATNQGEAATLNNIGYVHDDLGEKEKALDYYNQALLITQEVGDESGEATILNNIGVVYRTLDDNEKALDYYNQALLITQEVGDKSGEATILNNIGGVYRTSGDNEKALEYYNQVLLIDRQADDKSSEATTLNNIGLVYSALGENRRRSNSTIRHFRCYVRSETDLLKQRHSSILPFHFMTNIISMKQSTI